MGNQLNANWLLDLGDMTPMALDLATAGGYSQKQAQDRAEIEALFKGTGKAKNFGGLKDKRDNKAQWTFQPSPYDQFNYAGGMQSTAVPGAMAGGGMAPAQGTAPIQQPAPAFGAQPQAAPQQPYPHGYGYYNQWAYNPFIGY